LCRRRKGETQDQALGRSRGGFSTKLHLRTNAEGLPVALLLTPGEAANCTAFGDLMAEHDANPRVLFADRGYDSDVIRAEVRARDGTAEIPTMKNRRVQHSVNRTAYSLRNRIERFINRLKNSRRVATRYDHTASSFLGFAMLATIRHWISFVRAA
jgi:transposase